MPTLYFKNTNALGTWDDVLNWFEDDACTIQAVNVPWVTGDSTYLGYDLTRSSASVAAEDQVYIYVEIGNGFTITGTCDIGYIGIQGNYGYLTNYNGIYAGTFSGTGFVNYGNIYAGVFSGISFANYGGIYGGTFSGDYSSNNYGTAYIYGGTFSGVGFDNYAGNIADGVFSGDNFNNRVGANISAGGFSGDNFVNDASMINNGIFSGAGFTLVNDGKVNSGSWLQFGSVDFPIKDINTYMIVGYHRISGKNVSNPVPIPGSASEGAGFFTIGGIDQDVLQGGLI